MQYRSAALDNRNDAVSDRKMSASDIYRVEDDAEFQEHELSSHHEFSDGADEDIVQLKVREGAVH